MDRHGLPVRIRRFSLSCNQPLPAKATEHLPRKKDGSINAYALGIAAQHTHHFETNQLINAMRACLTANVQLVTTQLDHELILTEVVVKLLGESDVPGTPVSRLSRH
jgi:DNA polymerase-3 subunit delta